MPDNNKKVRDLLGEIDTQKRKTGIFAAPTPKQVQAYIQSKISESVDPVVAETVEQKKPETVRAETLPTSMEPGLPTAEHTKGYKNREGVPAGELLPTQTAESSKPSVNRSLKELLAASSHEEAKETGRMLAPSLERGFDTEIKLQDEESAPKEFKHEADPTAHPLFTSSRSIDLERIREERLKQEVLSAAMAHHRYQNITPNDELRMDEASRRRSTEGLLNVKDKINDQFREFFNDTVYIDRDPTSIRRSKQRRIKDFVPESEGQAAHLVYEDSKTDQNSDIIDEYRCEEDTEIILEELMSRQAKSVMRMLFTALLAVGLITVNLMSAMGSSLISFENMGKAGFPLLNLVPALLLFAINIKNIANGLKALVTARGGSHSCYGAAALFMVLEPVVYYLLGVTPASYICTPAGAFCLLFVNVALNISTRNILVSFKTVSSGHEKHVSFISEHDSLNRRLARELPIDDPVVLLKRKTGFSDKFMHHAFSTDINSYSYRFVPPILFFVSLVCGGVAYLRSNDPSVAARAFFLSVSLSATACALLKSVLPLSRMQNTVSRFGVTVPGFYAAERIGEVNSVLLDGRDLFPKGSVLLHGIKTFNDQRIDKAILYASSVIIPSCETLAPVFLNVIQGKTQMLYKTESISYEDGMGFTAWADGSRVLIGNRSMMEAHEISLPNLDYERKYTKTSGRDALYLAVGGTLFAMFVLSYSISTEVEKSLKHYLKEEISLIVRTNDFNITRRKVSEIYAFPQSMITVLKKSDAELMADELSYKAHSDSFMGHIGSLTSFTTGLMACHRLLRCLRLTNALGLCARVLGAAVALLLAALGSVGAVGLPAVLLFQLVWLAVIAVTAQFAKY